MSLREQIAQNIVSILKEIEDPHPVLVTREPFEPEKLAITQFPAILVAYDGEEKETITMGLPNLGRRMGKIRYTLTGYVRGTELDTKRNTFIEAIEEALDSDRYLNLYDSGVTDSQMVEVQVVPRLAPLAEFQITFEVKYNYVRTQA